MGAFVSRRIFQQPLRQERKQWTIENEGSMKKEN
jgi:hypothetical protein